jgi:hypothetical protein
MLFDLKWRYKHTVIPYKAIKTDDNLCPAHTY